MSSRMTVGESIRVPAQEKQITLAATSSALPKVATPSERLRQALTAFTLDGQKLIGGYSKGIKGDFFMPGGIPDGLSFQIRVQRNLAVDSVVASIEQHELSPYTSEEGDRPWVAIFVFSERAQKAGVSAKALSELIQKAAQEAGYDIGMLSER